MKQKTFNGKMYSIPEKWNDVTVGMLIQASELSDMLEDAPIVAILSAYTGIPVAELKSNRATEVNEIVNIMEFLQFPYEPIPNNTFEYDGSIYVASDDLRNQKFEDFVSIQTALYNFRDVPERALPRLLAIYCKRTGETLDSFDLNERTDTMKQLPITTAKDIEAFFLLSLNAYKSITQLSFLIEKGEMQKVVLLKVEELKRIMTQSKEGTGWFSPTRYVIGYYQIYLWYIKKLLVRYFNSTSIVPSKKNWIATLKESLTKRLK